MEITIQKEDFITLYEILEENFPPDELRKRDDFLMLYINPLYSAYVEKEKNEIIGFMGAWEFEDFLYLEYFATKKEYHGRGKGTEMLKEFIQNSNKPICLEVELPALSETAKRRVVFYERMGFKLNVYPYIQPPYSEEKNPVELMIMTLPEKINAAMFEKYKKQIYTKVYGIKS